MTLIKAKRGRIRKLNDAFRKTLDPKLGKAPVSAGFINLDMGWVIAIRKTKTFDAFNRDNDPHGEHDFGNFEIGKQRFSLKIDYYDTKLRSGSEDPSDESKTAHVLTIMLAEEY